MTDSIVDNVARGPERAQADRSSIPSHTLSLVVTQEVRHMGPDDWRVYAVSLRDTADVYRRAADAPGLRKDAAAYLRSEADRLEREGAGWDRMADEREEQE